MFVQASNGCLENNKNKRPTAQGYGGFGQEPAQAVVDLFYLLKRAPKQLYFSADEPALRDGGNPGMPARVYADVDSVNRSPSSSFSSS